MSIQRNLNDGTVKELLRRIYALEHNSNLNHSAIGREGLEVYDGGWIRILNGGLQVIGTATISGALDVTGTFTASGTNNLSGENHLTGPTDITGDAEVSGTLDVTAGGKIKAGTVTLDPASGGKVGFANGSIADSDGLGLGISHNAAVRINADQIKLNAPTIGMTLASKPASELTPIGIDAVGNIYRIA